jgi:hypothetical protein
MLGKIAVRMNRIPARSGERSPPDMSFPRVRPLRRIQTAVTLLVGIALGWAISHSPAPLLQANGHDRSGESILVSGPILIRYNDGTKLQIPQDALYYLDYKGARLLATVPMMQQSVGSTRLLDSFAERDLIADFKLDPDAGPKPHFLMTTGALGTYSDGWAPLYVFETATNQVAVYKVEQTSVGRTMQAKLNLIEVRALKPPALR